MSDDLIQGLLIGIAALCCAAPALAFWHALHQRAGTRVSLRLDDIKIVARGSGHFHTYRCGSCGKQIIGLDYCIPMDWAAGFSSTGDTYALKYACSDECSKKLTWEMRP